MAAVLARSDVGLSKFEQAQVAYRGTIRTFARNCVFQLPGFDLEDIEQELLVVLWRCVEQYDPDRGASFNTLFQGCARNKVISMVRAASTKGRKANLVALDEEALRAEIERACSTECSAEDIVLEREEAWQLLRGLDAG